MNHYRHFRLLLLLTCLFWESALFSQTIAIHQIDVGSGDATLIVIRNTAGQINLLIDAGPKGAAGEVLRYMTNPNLGNLGAIPYLDYVITSHYHEDHLGGFVGTKKRDNTGCFIFPGILGKPGVVTNFYAVLDKGTSNPTSGSAIYSEYQTLATLPTNRRVTVGALTVGQFGAINQITPPAHALPPPVPGPADQLALGGTINLGVDANNVPIRMRLWFADGKAYAPNKPPSFIWNVADSAGVNRNNPGSRGNANNWGLAWVLEYGKFRYFSGGDIGGYLTNSYLDIEGPIVAGLPSQYTTPLSAPGHICVFKSDHHGSEHSTSTIFLNGTKPTVCAISCGTRHGHPTQEVIDRMMAANWHAADLLYGRVRNFYMTEYYPPGNVDTAYGLTSGNMYGILTNVPVPAAPNVTAVQMLNLAYIYYLDRNMAMTNLFPGDIKILVYPDNGHGQRIDQLSEFKVQGRSYNSGAWLPLKTYDCHN